MRSSGFFRMAMAGVLAAATSHALAGQQPQFRATADLVSVDVSVHQGETPVRDLRPADFRLTDNGVAQRVDIGDATAMPIDVTLVVDTSMGTGGSVSSRVTDDDVRQQVQRNIGQIASLLRPDDRLRVVTSDTYIRQVVASRAGAAVGLDVPSELTVLGQASTYDSLAAVLMLPVEPDRRHLIVAWMKPVDTMSPTDEASLREVARSSDAVLHLIERDLFVMRPGSAPMIAPLHMRLQAAAAVEGLGGDAGSIPFGGPAPLPALIRPPSAADFTQIQPNETKAFVRTWRPFARVAPSLLPELAALTGGTHRGLGLLADLNAGEVFKDIFEAFRQGYVLRYRPQGVRREGRHELVVTVPRYPGATIRARRGYTVDTDAVPAAAEARAAAGIRGPSPGGPITIPASLADLVSLFDRVDDTAFGDVARRSPNLRRFLREYQAAETPWPAQPRLESIFVLELLAAGMLSDDSDTREAAVALLARHLTLVRHPVGADRFECAWYVAAVSTAQAAYLADVTSNIAAKALERCPIEGALRLAQAVATDQLWSLGPARARASGDAARALDIASVLQGYEAVIDRSRDVAPEAAVRAAWAAYRARDFPRALAEVQRLTGPVEDPIVNYYHHLISAQVFRRLERTDDAARSYRSALLAWPGAQSARVGLTTLLIELGSRAEASVLSEAVQAAPTSQIDPWWVYWNGGYRSFTQQVRQLRAMAR